MAARLLLVLLIALAFVGSVAVVNAIGDAQGTYFSNRRASATQEPLGDSVMAARYLPLLDSRKAQMPASDSLRVIQGHFGGTSSLPRSPVSIRSA
jgi:hypothetical protein